MIAITHICRFNNIFVNRKKLIVRIWVVFSLCQTLWPELYRKHSNMGKKFFDSHKDFRIVIIRKITDSVIAMDCWEKIKENKAWSHGKSRDANICVTNRTERDEHSRSGSKIHQETISETKENWNLQNKNNNIVEWETREGKRRTEMMAE